MNLVLYTQHQRTRPLHVTLNSQWPTEVSVYRTSAAATVGLSRALPVSRSDTRALDKTRGNELRRHDGTFRVGLLRVCLPSGKVEVYV